MMIQIFKFTVIVMALYCGLSSCRGKTEKVSTEREKKKDVVFSLPDIPLTIATAEARNSYLVMHYWDHFDFSDTSLISKPEITEQVFVDFIQLVQQSKQSASGINAMLNASKQNKSFLIHMCDLSEKYLYDPNSPMRNEELYIPVLEYIIGTEMLSDEEKIRPKYQLEMLQKNRLGHIATDFSYMLSNGTRGNLSEIDAEYTILFFNDPDCHDCQRVKTYIEQSKVFSQIMIPEENNRSEARMIVLGIYPGVNEEGWKATAYPDVMLNAYDASLTIMNEELYDLKAFPSLYLLDKNKRVLLKDAQIEAIEKWIEKNM